VEMFSQLCVLVHICQGPNQFRIMHPDASDGVAEAYCSQVGYFLRGSEWLASPLASVQISKPQTCRPFNDLPTEHVFSVVLFSSPSPPPEGGEPRIHCRSALVMKETFVSLCCLVL